MLNIALPKGRLGDKAYELLKRAGYDCPDYCGDNRKLVLVNEEKQLRFFLVKPSDVAIYVERGAADIGVVGKDILYENASKVYELADLGMGNCTVCVAAKNGFADDINSVLRVATKYPNIAKNYYNRQNRQIDIIKLNGSIELAPILGLSDVIVDIVETGTTLRENDMQVIAKIADVSARLIANMSSYKFKSKEISELTERLKND